MSDCKLLQEIKKKIEAGTPPDEAIPFSIHCASESEYVEVLYYALQVLPDGRRRTEVRNKLDEVLEHVRRTDSKL